MFETWTQYTQELLEIVLGYVEYLGDRTPSSSAPVISAEWAPAHVLLTNEQCEGVAKACTLHPHDDPREDGKPVETLWGAVDEAPQPSAISGCLLHSEGPFGRRHWSSFFRNVTLQPPAKLSWADDCSYSPREWASFVNASALLAARSDELGFMWWNEVVLGKADDAEVTRAIFLLEENDTEGASAEETPRAAAGGPSAALVTPLREAAAAESRRRGVPLLLANSRRAVGGGDLFSCAEEGREEVEPIEQQQPQPRPTEQQQPEERATWVAARGEEPSWRALEPGFALQYQYE